MPAERVTGDVVNAAAAAAKVAEILAALNGCRFLWASEDDLQRGLAQALDAAGFEVEREARLDGRDRVDLLIGRVGLEVKVNGSWRDVDRQLRRYLRSDRLDALILVTARARHRRIPAGDGKVLVIHQLAASGL